MPAHDSASTSRTRFIRDAHDSRLGRRSLGGVDDGDAVGCVPLPVSVVSVTGGAIGLWPVSMVKAEGDAVNRALTGPRNRGPGVQVTSASPATPGAHVVVGNAEDYPDAYSNGNDH
jgi:hypothetical protein